MKLKFDRMGAYFAFCPVCSPARFCFFPVRSNGLARLSLSVEDDDVRERSSFRRFKFKLRRRSPVC